MPQLPPGSVIARFDFSVSYGITGTQLLVPSDSSLSAGITGWETGWSAAETVTSEIAIPKASTRGDWF